MSDDWTVTMRLPGLLKTILEEFARRQGTTDAEVLETWIRDRMMSEADKLRTKMAGAMPSLDERLPIFLTCPQMMAVRLILQMAIENGRLTNMRMLYGTADGEQAEIEIEVCDLVAVFSAALGDPALVKLGTFGGGVPS